jgi:roadblock/LC7 domain-containing protein
MTASLDELAKVDGVVAAGEFRLDGTLVDFKSSMDMSEEIAGAAAQFCASVSMLFNTLAPAFEGVSGMRWAPQQGWAYSGGDYTVAIGSGGTKGVFIETAKADFNQLFGLLVGEE